MKSIDTSCHFFIFLAGISFCGASFAMESSVNPKDPITIALDESKNLYGILGLSYSFLPNNAHREKQASADKRLRDKIVSQYNKLSKKYCKILNIPHEKILNEKDKTTQEIVLKKALESLTRKRTELQKKTMPLQELEKTYKKLAQAEDAYEAFKDLNLARTVLLTKTTRETYDNYVFPSPK